MKAPKIKHSGHVCPRQYPALTGLIITSSEQLAADQPVMKVNGLVIPLQQSIEAIEERGGTIVDVATSSMRTLPSREIFGYVASSRLFNSTQLSSAVFCFGPRRCSYPLCHPTDPRISHTTQVKLNINLTWILKPLYPGNDYTLACLQQSKIPIEYDVRKTPAAATTTTSQRYSPFIYLPYLVYLPTSATKPKP